MKEYKYIVIGGGMTGSSGVMGIRKNDPDGKIAMFSQEPHKPYNRPPLTKGLWDGKELEEIIRPIEKYDVDLFLETKIVEVNPEEKTVRTKNGEEFHYEKLLIATGGDPIQLPRTPEGVIFYRTRDDFQQLKEKTKTKQTFCVIGGGFIGSEIAAALTKNGKQVTMMFPEIGISGLRFPDDLAEFLNGYYQEKGVIVLNGYLVEGIDKKEDTFMVKYRQKDSEETCEKEYDSVIIGIGIKPNVKLAEDAGLDVEDGIVVNEYLQTSDPDIFAAGDVAYFKYQGLDKHTRVEHEDNANTMGMLAGKNMSGKMESYDHIPFFYSDLFDLGYEAVGEMNKDYEIFSDWIEPFKKGTIYYLKDYKIRGIIFWNLWGKVDIGRELIREGKEYQKDELKGLFSD
jgi:NADPH-dependent 2,4-dienoyl-CoA reductase/sulfur reductase-like enzyme